MFTDEHKASVWDTLRQHDLQPLSRLLPDALVKSAAGRAGISLGSGSLNIVTLAWLALLSAVERGKSFANVLQLTLKLLHDAQQWRGEPSPSLVLNSHRNRRSAKGKGRERAKRPKHSGRSKHDPRGGDPNLVTEEAFVQARDRMPQAFWASLILLLGDSFEHKHGEMLRWKKYRLLALDGTTINLPGYKALADHFGTASNQHGKNRGKTPVKAGRRTVQARMVMLQFPLARLPWRYTVSPLSQGEPTVAGPLLDQLRGDDLVLMDRNFFNYGLFWRIERRNAFFAIRLPASVKYKRVKKLGDKDWLVNWKPSNSSKQWKGYPKSIDLRVIDYQIKGFRPSAIVTNATDPRAVSRQDWTRLASQSVAGRHLDVGLYHRRWEIETTFLELKVEQEMEATLRGRKPNCIEYEIGGHVTLYLLTRWLMVEAALQSGKDPLRLSFIEAMRELNDLRPRLLTANAKQISGHLLPLLLQRLASHEVPWRPGRYDPRPADTKTKNRGHGRLQKPAKLETDKA